MKIAELPGHLKKHGLRIVRCWWDKDEFIVGVDTVGGEHRKPWHTDEYIEYLSSPAWQGKREAKLAFSPKCEKKNRHCKGSLQVHHKSYNNLGNEQLSELATLCEFHHRAEHVAIERRRHGRNRYNKGFDTWMLKRHGHDWEEWASDDLIYSEQETFDDWIDAN